MTFYQIIQTTLALTMLILLAISPGAAIALFSFIVLALMMALNYAAFRSKND